MPINALAQHFDTLRNILPFIIIVNDRLPVIQSVERFYQYERLQIKHLIFVDNKSANIRLPYIVIHPTSITRNFNIAKAFLAQNRLIDQEGTSKNLHYCQIRQRKINSLTWLATGF